jgi:alcohol dehydrogenase, propanol-preferring
MLAMTLHQAGEPLRAESRRIPEPERTQLLLRVRACGVCRTDLHVVDGELPHPRLPIVPGHEIVGEVIAAGDCVDAALVGRRVGVPWLGWTCGACRFCRSGRENLCDRARFTGYQLDGGYAEYMLADARYCFPLPPTYGDLEAAPLLCAGLIGFRSLRMTGDAARVGIYGFGAAAHIVTQVARHEGRRVFAFTRPGDTEAQRFALAMGAEWAGDSDSAPPEELDAAILFAPVGALVPAALRAVAKGGTVVSGGIHMSEIPAFPYEILWGERVLRSVANLTREDGRDFLALAPQIPIRTTTQPYPLRKANQALLDLRAGNLQGAAVLVPD